MPFINSKITVSVTDEKKELLQSNLVDAVVNALDKPREYVMVGIEDKYNLWMAGEKVEKGAFVSVRLMGDASADNYNKLTQLICDLYKKELDIPGTAVYVTYHSVKNWGWDRKIL